MVFFFYIGAAFDLRMVALVALPATVLAALLLLVKPVVFRWLLMRRKEEAELSREVGVRLGQASEFALLIAVLALQTGFIGEQASYLIQITMLLTFIVSSTWIGLRYPSPLAISARLRRD